jgi:hypothetical protein
MAKLNEQLLREEDRVQRGLLRNRLAVLQLQRLVMDAIGAKSAELEEHVDTRFTGVFGVGVRTAYYRAESVFVRESGQGRSEIDDRVEKLKKQAFTITTSSTNSEPAIVGKVWDKLAELKLKDLVESHGQVTADLKTVREARGRVDGVMTTGREIVDVGVEQVVAQAFSKYGSLFTLSSRRKSEFSGIVG